VSLSNLFDFLMNSRIKRKGISERSHGSIVAAPKNVNLCKQRTSHLHRKWFLSSTSFPHKSQVGSAISPILCKCPLRMECPVTSDILFRELCSLFILEFFRKVNECLGTKPHSKKTANFTSLLQINQPIKDYLLIWWHTLINTT